MNFQIRRSDRLGEKKHSHNPVGKLFLYLSGESKDIAGQFVETPRTPPRFFAVCTKSMNLLDPEEIICQ